MAERLSFPYLASAGSTGEVGLRPIMPIVLSNGNQSQEGLALVDSGSDVNVLP